MREHQQSMGNSLQSQMSQISEGLDRQTATATAIAPIASNPWGIGSAGPSSSSFSRSQPFSVWGLSSYQSSSAMDAEPTPAPPKDYRLAVNRHAPIQVLTPPTVPTVIRAMGIAYVNVPAGAAPRPVDTIDLDPSAQRANEQAIGAQSADPQSGQSGSKMSLGSAMKSISSEKCSSQDKGQDKDQDVEVTRWTAL